MEKIKKPILKKFSPTQLYLDDILDIIDVLKKGNFEEIKIETSTHKYNENEIKNISDGNNIFKISSSGPFYISINFEEAGGDISRIYADEDSIEAEGVVKKIEEILLKNKRRLFSLLSSLSFAFSFLLLIQITTNILWVKKIIQTQSFYILTICSFFLYIIMSLMDYGKISKKNIFIYKNKSFQENFWIKNKDQLVVGIIIAIITAAITIPATIYFN